MSPSLKEWPPAVSGCLWKVSLVLTRLLGTGGMLASSVALETKTMSFPERVEGKATMSIGMFFQAHATNLQIIFWNMVRRRAEK